MTNTDPTANPVQSSTDLDELGRAYWSLYREPIRERFLWRIERMAKDFPAEAISIKDFSYEESMERAKELDPEDWSSLMPVAEVSARGHEYPHVVYLLSDDGPLDFDGQECKVDGCRLARIPDEEIQKVSAAITRSNPWAETKIKRIKGGGQVEWLIPGILERRKLMALFGPPKTGKSLWALEQALKLMEQGKRVTYFDEENDPPEVYERALDMGYDLADERISSRLDYRSFTGLNVDVEEDAEKILELAGGRDLVIFDSYAKFFSKGSQSDDAAVNRAYRLTLSPLKQAGTAIIRLDHTGHGDSTRPSGSVQKLADVDHNWLIKAESAPGRSARKITLTHTENRTGRGEDVIIMDRLTEPLRHAVRGQEPLRDIEADESEQEKVQAVVEALDALGAPLSWSVNECLEALRKSGQGARKPTVSSAQKLRKASPGQ